MKLTKTQKGLANLVQLKVDMFENKALSNDFKEFLSTNEDLIANLRQESLPQLSEKSKDKIKGLKKSDAIDKELSEYAVFRGRSRDGLLNRSSKDLAGDDSLFVTRLVLLFNSYVDQKKESLTSRKFEIVTVKVERYEGTIKENVQQRLKPKLSFMQRLGKICGITPKPSTAHIEEADTVFEGVDLDKRMGGARSAAQDQSPSTEAALTNTASLVGAVGLTMLSALEAPKTSDKQSNDLLDEVARKYASNLEKIIPAVPSGNLDSGGNDKGDGKGGGGGGGDKVAVAIAVPSGLGKRGGK